MKFITTIKNLKNVLQVASKISAKNLNLPILNTVLLKTDNNTLRVLNTNLEIGINYRLGALVEEKGEVALPVKIFSDFISYLDEEKVKIQVKKNIAHITSGTYKTVINGFNTKEFPLIPHINNKITGINTKLLLYSLTSVIDSVSLSSIRPELNGILFKFTDNKFYLTSTDSFRLSERVIPVENKENISVIVPRNTVIELIKLITDRDEDISIHVLENQIQFSGENFDMISRLIDGKYPDYKKIIPTKYVSKAVYKKSDLEKNIKMTGLFASTINDIKIQIKKDTTQLLAKNSDKGEMNSSVSSVLTNEPFELSLNYMYLLDGLKNIKSDSIVIEYTGEGSPIIVRPDDKDIYYTYLIMPLKN